MSRADQPDAEGVPGRAQGVRSPALKRLRATSPARRWRRASPRCRLRPYAGARVLCDLFGPAKLYRAVRRHPPSGAVRPQSGLACLLRPGSGMAEATRRKVYDMLVAEKMMVQGFHYPFPSVAHIEKSGYGYREIPVAWEPSPISCGQTTPGTRSRRMGRGRKRHRRTARGRSDLAARATRAEQARRIPRRFAPARHARRRARAHPDAGAFGGHDLDFDTWTTW